MQQLICQTTHLLSASTFIDLVFNDQLNSVVHSGVYPSLHKNCYHSATFSYSDCGDIICDQVYNVPFDLKLESIQYNAGLAKTRAKRWVSREKLNYALGFFQGIPWKQK